MSASPEKVHLPIVEETASSLNTDGSRRFVHPADVSGRFVRARRVVFVFLILVLAALPWVRIAGRPAMFLDVPARRFFLFGASFNAQDFWFVFFLLTGAVFALVFVTALLGRAWCGWACPQTVFLESLYRPIERLLEGPRNVRIRRDAGPWSWDRVWRKGVKWSAYLFVSFFVAHVFLAYFVSLPSLFSMVTKTPADHPEAFGWMLGVSLVFLVNFGWFREQLCLVVCPYGRLQSVLLDDDSLVVGYDAARGEPRGKARGKQKTEGVGDCVDCNRCVVVCPTGIDIRRGLQVDCIACAQCADACDEVMDKLGRPRGLVRYDSLRGLRDEKRRVLRPRLAFYTVLGVVGIGAATVAFGQHAPFEANLLRLPGPPYIVERGSDAAHDVVRNQFEIHVVNKQDQRRTFRIEASEARGAMITVGQEELSIDPLASRTVTVIVRQPRATLAQSDHVRLRVAMQGDAQPRELRAPLLGPRL